MRYLAFLGRISPEKRVDRAIEIAKACGCPLKIAAKVDPADAALLRAATIEPLLDHPLVEFIGEIAETQKGDFLGGARALLFPIDWPEPFGLVMIESLACGTPVVAIRGGRCRRSSTTASPGSSAITWTRRSPPPGAFDTLDRRACRRAFERRFTATRMAEEYVQLYRRLAADAALYAD